MKWYVKAGFTPMEAIQAATIVPARVLGLAKETGSIEVGKRAGIVIVNGDPLFSIADLRKVDTVIAGERAYASSQRGVQALRNLSIFSPPAPDRRRPHSMGTAARC